MKRSVIIMMCLLAAAAARGGESIPQAKSVRFVYLVSADRSVDKDYIRTIEQAARDVQQWYAEQLDGWTFRLHCPVVDVVLSDKDAAWFTTNPTDKKEASWGFYNTLDEMKRLLGVKPRQDGYVWVIYSDGPGHSGRAFRCFAYLPEDDLLGLMGRHPTQKDPKRWAGGLAHELGHALGLPHPKDTKKHARAIMWAGFYGYFPKGSYLTEEDKKILAANRFIIACEQAAVKKEKK